MPLTRFADKKILIVRFSSIGDIVLTTPVIRCLKIQTGAKVHFITKKSYQSILESNPYLDKVIGIDKNIKEVITTLKEEQYDYIVDLHKNLRSKYLAIQLGVKNYTFDKINFQKWLMVNLKINKLPAVHIVDRYIKAVEVFGVENDGKGLDYFIPESVKKNKSIFKERFPNLDINQPYLAFAIGAAHATKRLPKVKIIDICKLLNQPIVLLGGPSEAAEGEEIATAAGKHVVNACGSCSLHESAYLIQRAEQVISHDTGMMHIAAAFQKPIISIWGNTIPKFGMYPYYENGVNNNKIVQKEGLSCRPCSKIGFQQCPKGHFKCMNELETADIISLLS